MKLKKLMLLLVSLFLVILLIFGIAFFVIHKDKKLNEKIETSNLEILKPLLQSDSSIAVSNIKENIVKITNKINDKNVIYGTGFFDKSGYLVTNSHVVDIKGDISITYYDGSKSKANLISNDIVSDLALLSVDNIKVKALPLVSTINLKVTDELYSVGYQLNLEGEATVTKGILSAKRVSSGIEFLQTDAAVNSGGSGGPVINDLGEVLGIITLASNNATLSFAISSDTLSLYIDKLIDNRQVTYIEDKRNTNALSNVLKEVNYHTEDIYEEWKYLDNDYKNEDKENNKVNKNEVKKNYKISYNTPTPFLVNSELPKDIETYFILGKDLTNCKLDLSKVDITKNGRYDVTVKCNENSATTKITIYGPIPPNHIDIPNIVMDETKNNVENFEEIVGTWYYPGYKDVCQKFDIDRNGYYNWHVMTMSHMSGKLLYNTGGGIRYEKKDQFFSQAKFWLEGNFLIITTNEAQYTLTKIKGEGLYDENHYFITVC